MNGGGNEMYRIVRVGDNVQIGPAFTSEMQANAEMHDMFARGEIERDSGYYHVVFSAED